MMRRRVNLSCLSIVLSLFFVAMCFATEATAGTVFARVTGPAANYLVQLFRTGDARPTGAIYGSVPNGGRYFTFTGVPSGSRYFIRGTLNIGGDLFTHQTNDAYLGWFPWMYLGTLDFSHDGKPSPRQPAAVEERTWSQVKNLYRD